MTTNSKLSPLPIIRVGLSVLRVLSIGSHWRRRLAALISNCRRFMSLALNPLKVAIFLVVGSALGTITVSAEVPVYNKDQCVQVSQQIGINELRASNGFLVSRIKNELFGELIYYFPPNDGPFIQIFNCSTGFVLYAPSGTPLTDTGPWVDYETQIFSALDATAPQWEDNGLGEMIERLNDEGIPNITGLRNRISCRCVEAFPDLFPDIPPEDSSQ